LLLILLMSLPRLFFLFRKRTAEEARYFEVTSEQRWTIAGLYFGLVAFLVLAMGPDSTQPLKRGVGVLVYSASKARQRYHAAIER